MTYDLRRLRRKGIVARLPASNRYIVTSYGLRVALFCSKLYLRLLRPAWAAFGNDDDSITRPLRKAFQQLEVQIHHSCDAANLSAA